MANEMIIIPSRNGWKHDVFVLPPTTKPFKSFNGAKYFVIKAIQSANIKHGDEAPEKDIKKTVLETLEKRGFIILNACHDIREYL